MSERLQIVEVLNVASPCDAPWEEMHGTARQRICDGCSRSVFNVRTMTAQQVERELARSNHVCMRIERRVDGSVIYDEWGRFGRLLGSLAGMAMGLGAIFGAAAPRDALAEENPESRFAKPKGTRAVTILVERDDGARRKLTDEQRIVNVILTTKENGAETKHVILRGARILPVVGLVRADRSSEQRDNRITVTLLVTHEDAARLQAAMAAGALSLEEGKPAESTNER